MGQYGKAADSSGVKTTPETVQKIIAAQYENTSVSPLIGGGEVTGLGTLAFQVSAGVGVCTTSAGAVQVAWDNTQTALITPPTSGTATWVVYVDVDGSVQVGKVPVPPPYVTLAQFSVPAGTTATTSLTNTWNTNYALSYGSNLGTLVWWPELAPAGVAAASEFVATLQFYVPTDRIVSVDITQEIWYGPNFDLGRLTPQNTNSGACRWNLSVDSGALNYQFELPYDQRRVLRQRVLPLSTLQKGSHTISVKRTNMGSFTGYHFGNTDGYDQGYYAVRDLGAAQ